MREQSPTKEVSGAKSIAYLSGALRVSTKDNASTLGGRSHVVGVINAFDALGWSVKPYIVGDQAPGSITAGPSSLRALQGGKIRSLIIDLARLVLRSWHRVRAERRIGREVSIAYERQASFHALGKRFQRAGIPWILESNGLFYYEADIEVGGLGLRRLARRIELDAYRKCDMIVAVSESLKSLIIDAAGVPAAKVLVMPNAVDATRFSPDATIPNRLDERFTIGFIGYITAWAGLAELFQATAMVVDEGLDIAVTIVGDGQELARLKELVSSLEMADRVHFVGQVAWSKVASYVAGFDVGFSGQRVMQIGAMYHSPLKMYEYAAMGIPVIASNHPDARELTDCGKDGFIFEEGIPDSLASAIRTCLLKSGEERQMMGESARARVVTRHSWLHRVGSLINELKTRDLI